MCSNRALPLMIHSFNIKIKLQKPTVQNFIDRIFLICSTMDLFNLTETERPLMEANSNKSESHFKENVNYFDVMEIVQLSIAPVGIIGNLTVIVVFMSHRKLRSKIPNRFIVNQVIILIMHYYIYPHSLRKFFNKSTTVTS